MLIDHSNWVSVSPWLLCVKSVCVLTMNLKYCVKKYRKKKKSDMIFQKISAVSEVLIDREMKEILDI